MRRNLFLTKTSAQSYTQHPETQHSNVTVGRDVLLKGIKFMEKPWRA